MEQQYLRAFEAQCTQEEPPACQTMCPLHVEARSFCKLMAEGRFADARKVLERSMPLAGLTGLLCAGDCMAHCRRAEVDGAVNMPLLERACVLRTKSVKPMAMPATGKALAVAGAGLSSLVLAWELARKGHKITIFHSGPLGGRLVKEPGLPGGALQEALDMLTALRVEFVEFHDFSAVWAAEILKEHPALYAGLDDPALSAGAQVFGGISDHLTQETATPGVFAGGQLGGGTQFVASGPAPAPSYVREAADGKRAAGSITRLLQGVSPATAREHEDTYASALFTDISAVPPAPPVTPADPAAPDEAEARAEGARCIQCECLECVKRCAYLAAFKGYPKRYAREMYNNLSVVHGLRRSNTQINSCAQCGLCAAVCPQGADMGAFCAEARREMVRSRRMPPSAHEFALEDMAFSNAPDLAFFRHQPGMDKSAWAFFPGCQLPASLPVQTGAVYEHLRRHLPRQDKGGVGFFLHCCGAPARWSGRDLLTARSAEALRAQWEAAGKPTLILACASCLAFFTAELEDIPVLSLWDVLADLPLPESASALPAPLALHDPCAARKTGSTRQSVRSILGLLAQDVEELAQGRELTRCCGYGGLASAANPPLAESYARDRAADTQNTLLAYCIMCRDRLRATGKPALHLLDLLFAGGETVGAAERPAPGISARQENRQDFRRDLLQSLWNETPPGDSAMDEVTLSISDNVARTLEVRRILHSDIKAVLLHAREQGAQFHNPATGRSLACLRPKQVTFWVEYSADEGGGYRIHDAYCHRMVVPGVPGEGLPTAATLEGYADKGGRM